MPTDLTPEEIAQREEYLQMGFDEFEIGLGSTPYEPAVEEGWKNLYRFKVGKNLAWIPAEPERIPFLKALARWQGEQAAAVPRATAAVTVREVNITFPMVQERAYRLNGDVATNLC